MLTDQQFIQTVLDPLKNTVMVRYMVRKLLPQHNQNCPSLL